MRVRGDKAILTVVQVSPENKGDYICKAANSVGETLCKAHLEIVGKFTSSSELQLTHFYNSLVCIINKLCVIISGASSNLKFIIQSYIRIPDTIFVCTEVKSIILG